ncbi:hypothetical protein AB4076_20325 [Dyella sp. 2RAF44]|jgi:hypothetical protein|uniref:hypothetical protein n=1 Tax=Dyella sp. 2RAF44 TaxID=3233000 RepID=UPI003F8DF564
MRARDGAIQIYLYVSGLALPRSVSLGHGLSLQPVEVNQRPYLPGTVGSAMATQAAGVVYLFLGQVRAQVRVEAETTKQLVARAWNTHWDILFLNAAFDRDAQINLTSETPADELEDTSIIDVESYALRGFGDGGPPASLSETDCLWLESHIAEGRRLLEQELFQNSLHCLATYRWHSLPRARLALLWAGIEGLFHVDGEIRFRLSACIARFLGGDNAAERKLVFDQVKRLYNGRSTAVHGGLLKGDTQTPVSESAALLRRLIRQCVELGQTPPKDGFIP